MVLKNLVHLQMLPVVPLSGYVAEQHLYCMKPTVILRFVIVGLLWLAVCGALLVRSQSVTLYTLFVIAASGIIVFVPMYKKYVKNDRRR